MLVIMDLCNHIIKNKNVKLKNNLVTGRNRKKWKRCLNCVIIRTLRQNHPGRTIWLEIQHQGFEEAQIYLGRNHFQSMARFEIESSTEIL